MLRPNSFIYLYIKNTQGSQTKLSKYKNGVCFIQKKLLPLTIRTDNQ